MSGAPRITDAELEAYLDDQMTAGQRESFERRLVADPAARQACAERRSLDDELRAALRPSAVTVEQVERWLPADEPTVSPVRSSPVRSSRRRRLVLAGLAVAASVAWLIVLWQWRGDPKLEPFFEPQSLVQIYEETVSEGFRPYYLCDDEARFADTLAKRQHVPLRLAQLPPGRTMAGLSYLGGLSRDTTAMLGHVDEQPVMVFIDRRQFRPDAILTIPEDAGLFIHESTLGDLTLLEVSPFADPRMMQFLQVVE